ncbi:HAMP domain-containing histidine kinase [bacterium]|nr:HAMP domain-containing histidine kinase [bacterium]
MLDYQRPKEKAVAIHQAMTPLTNLWLDLEAHELEDDNENVDWVTMREQLKLAVELLNGEREKLDLEKEVFSPVAVVEEIVRTYRKPYQVKLTLCKPQKAITLFGREDKFAQMMICLLNNAAESYYSGQIKREVAIHLEIVARKLYVMVIDGGRGMYWWQKAIVTQPGISFKQVKSGIGLTQVKQILSDEFDGCLKFLSEPHLGTLAVALIPLN